MSCSFRCAITCVRPLGTQILICLLLSCRSQQSLKHKAQGFPLRSQRQFQRLGDGLFGSGGGHEPHLRRLRISTRNLRQETSRTMHASAQKMHDTVTGEKPGLLSFPGGAAKPHEVRRWQRSLQSTLVLEKLRHHFARRFVSAKQKHQGELSPSRVNRALARAAS